MKTSKLARKFLAIAGASVLALSFAATGIASLTANAASTTTNIFTEDLEDNVLSESNKWVASKSDSTAVGIDYVGTPLFAVAPQEGAAVSAIQFDNEITIGEKQYIEFTVTVAGMYAPTHTTFDFKFSDTKAANAFDIKPGEGEGISFYAANESAAVCTIFTENTGVQGSNGWGQQFTGNVEFSPAMVNGNSALGINTNDYALGTYSLQWRLYDTGVMLMNCGSAYQNNWWTPATAGIYLNNWVWTECPGLNVADGGYLQLIMQGEKEVLFGQMEVATYSYENLLVDNAWTNGTLVEGSKYTEDFDALENSSFKAIASEMNFKPSIKALVVDNAADDDFVAKKTKLSAPDSMLAETIYGINTELIIPELAGTAKSVVYLGADSASDLSAAGKLEFAVNAEGKITASADGKTAVTALEIGEQFNLQVLAGNEGVNQILINNAPVMVSETEALTLTKQLSEKWIAFGTTGVAEANKAAIAIVKASITKYNYQQGTGGDFVETFDGGKWNPTNMSIWYQVLDEEMPQFFYANKEAGTLVVDNVGYTAVVSSKQMYGDFDMEVQFAGMGTTTDGTGNVLNSDFGIAWGRPTGESSYAVAGAANIFFHAGSGAGWNISQLPAGTTVTGQWFSADFKLPTGQIDEATGEEIMTQDIHNYDYSEGNLCIRVVMQGTTAKIYIYTEESAADHWNRLNPVTVIEGLYTYGTVGIMGMPTGYNLVAEIDSFSVKNLDEHKAENLIVGTEDDVIDLDFTPIEEEIPNPVEPNPTESDSTESTTPPTSDSTPADSKEEGGCFSTASIGAGVVALVTALGGVALGKKRRN